VSRKYIYESLMATLHKQRRWFNKLDCVSGELGSSESEEERSVLRRLHSMSLACKVMVLIWIEAGTDLGSVFFERERLRWWFGDSHKKMRVKQIWKKRVMHEMLPVSLFKKKSNKDMCYTIREGEGT
jgi:hypothetical protein